MYLVLIRRFRLSSSVLVRFNFQGSAFRLALFAPANLRFCPSNAASGVFWCCFFRYRSPAQKV